MSAWVLRVNGVAIRDLGWEVVGGAEPWSLGRRERPALSLNGWAGQQSAGFGREGPRVTPVVLMSRADTSGSTVSGRQADMDRLASALLGLLEVEWEDQPGRVRLCHVDTAQVEAAFREAYWVESIGALRVTIELIEDTPVSWAAESTVIAIGSTRARVPLGTAPSVPRFRFPGAFTGVTITYRSAAGKVLSTLVVGGSPGVQDYLEIDGGTFGSPSVVLSTNGTREDRSELFVSGDAALLLDPVDGDRQREFWPTIEANRSGVLEYVEAYR